MAQGGLVFPRIQHPHTLPGERPPDKRVVHRISLPRIYPANSQSHGVAFSSLGTALFGAVLECRKSKVRFLLKNVSRNVCNDAGYNLLMTALFIDDDQKRQEMFDYLLKKGVNVSYRHPSTGRDVLGMSCSLGRTDQVRSIIEDRMGDIDLQERDLSGLSPLHLAVEGGHQGAVRILLNVMARYDLCADIPDHRGLTPYIYARRIGRKDIARILVEKGNACVYRRDTENFRSADDWANIGVKEDMARKKQELKRQVEQYKVKGVLPPMREMQMLSHPRRIYSPLRSHRVQKVTSLMALNERIKQISTDRRTIMGKSVDTAFTLLGLKAEDSMVHATHFVESELDTSKVEEGLPGLSTMGQLSEMMQVLSEQQSSSFRKVAVRPKTPPPVKKKKKDKVSTLAILMAKERRRGGGGCRRSKSSLAARAAKKAEMQNKQKKMARISAAKIHHAPDSQTRNKRMGLK
ncbi:hypothetical protein CAPTEDRAFT_213024 [Capitella teleta]|uniref:Uncharacterized protein n=1 Tax=Capitella teleta TaxID=283909 RepID=R7URP9_CAPTE|nr:hypothetical protein CAPTEDRAFT_213024 [Capitella teleta]|eukprot:ELU06577.1 hypothetical protein CAPTEDRAFT_213024 [Capitella teleta]